MKKLIFIVAGLILLAPSIALAAGEAAEVGRMYQECINSGGRAATNYNAWVAQNGCICPGSSTGSGQITCSGASSSSSSTGSSGDIVTDSTRNVVTGMMNGNSQQTGIGLFGIGAAALIQGMQSDPAADARRAEEVAAKQQRQADLQRRSEQEAARQQELSKQRILGALKGTESSTELTLKTDSDQPLTVTTVRGTFGGTVVVPVNSGAPSVGGLQLKLGDDDEKSSAQAGQGFDTAGKMMGADLPPPPSAAKLEKINLLKVALQKGEDEEKALKVQLEQLQQAPAHDETAIKDVQQKIAIKEDDKKNIQKQLDLTAEDDDTVTGQPQGGPSARSGQ
jgi:hypothetical protein